MTDNLKYVSDKGFDPTDSNRMVVVKCKRHPILRSSLCLIWKAEAQGFCESMHIAYINHIKFSDFTVKLFYKLTVDGRCWQLPGCETILGIAFIRLSITWKQSFDAIISLLLRRLVDVYFILILLSTLWNGKDIS